MFQVKKKNKLNVFDKNNQRNTIIIASILGSLMIVGVITLYKTFAFYEEKREFNVLKGRVPEFSQEDIQLAFTINGEKGEKFPTIEEGLVAKNVTCSNGATASWSNSLWALININSNGNKKVYCSVEFVNGIRLNEHIKIGDYVSYTPIIKNYELDSQLSGCDSNQTINPSELNLWRVIRKNEDGSLELLSEYVSSSVIYFCRKKGYMNFVGVLNLLAEQYETFGITSNSRNLGFHTQTEYLSSLEEWNCSTNEACQPKEVFGGGDDFYEEDVLLVQKIYDNKLIAYDINERSKAKDYFISSRLFSWNEANFGYHVRFVTALGGIDSLYVYGFDGISYVDHFKEGSLRPIVVLESDIKASDGEGSISNPWIIN